MEIAEHRLHPLAEALGEEWRWLLDSPRQTVVILHPSGLYFEIGRDFLAPGRIDADEARAISSALRMGLLERKRGEVGLRVQRSPNMVSARLVAPRSAEIPLRPAELRE
jgi:hypothetical protein